MVLRPKDYKVIETLKKAIHLIKNSGIPYMEFGVFGSVSRGTYSINSDVDIALICNDASEINVSHLRLELKDIGCDLVVIEKRSLDNPSSLFHKEVKRDYYRISN